MVVPSSCPCASTGVLCCCQLAGWQAGTVCFSRVRHVIDQVCIACCRYMQRYAYDFVLNVDTDEYLWLRSDLVQTEKPLQVRNCPNCCGQRSNMCLCATVLPFSTCWLMGASIPRRDAHGAGNWDAHQVPCVDSRSLCTLSRPCHVCRPGCIAACRTWLVNRRDLPIAPSQTSRVCQCRHGWRKCRTKPQQWQCHATHTRRSASPTNQTCRW